MSISQTFYSISDLTSKGFFADLTALTTAHPVGEDGWSVILGSTDTIWVWDSDTSAWVDTNSGGGGTGDMLKSENLSGLANYATARSNLGLGSAALSNTTDFASALGVDDNYVTDAEKTNIGNLNTSAYQPTTAFAPALGVDDNYVTDAQLVVIGNTSGTNSGNQSIANSSDATSHTATLSASGGSLKLVEGAGITLATTGTGADGIVTITSTATALSPAYTITNVTTTRTYDANNVTIDTIADTLGTVIADMKVNDAIGGLLSITKTITSAQILALYDTPIECIPAPGAGKVIVFHYALGKIIFNTTAYDTNTGCTLNYTTRTGTQVGMFNNLLASTSTALITGFNLFSGTVINAPIVIAGGFSGNALNGNSDIEVTLFYEIITI